MYNVISPPTHPENVLVFGGGRGGGLDWGEGSELCREVSRVQLVSYVRLEGSGETLVQHIRPVQILEKRKEWSEGRGGMISIKIS